MSQYQIKIASRFHRQPIFNFEGQLVSSQNCLCFPIFVSSQRHNFSRDILLFLFSLFDHAEYYKNRHGEKQVYLCRQQLQSPRMNHRGKQTGYTLTASGYKQKSMNHTQWHVKSWCNVFEIQTVTETSRDRVWVITEERRDVLCVYD